MTGDAFRVSMGNTAAWAPVKPTWSEVIGHDLQSLRSEGLLVWKTMEEKEKAPRTWILCEAAYSALD